MSKQKKGMKQKKGNLKDNSSTDFYGYGYGYGGINSGGLVNPLTGQGTTNDKAKFNFFQPTFITAKHELEILEVESWAAGRFINKPVEMMFIRPRVFNDVNNAMVKKYENYLQHHKVNELLADALKGARLFGSAFMIFTTKESRLDTPLNLNELTVGDLCNIKVYDRFSVVPILQNFDITSINYFDAELYQVFPRLGGSFKVHRSRVLRFDGKKPLTSDGWTVYDPFYGVSEIIPVLEVIYQEVQTAGGISQMLSECSIPVFKTQDFRNALGSIRAPNEPSLEEIADSINRLKSVYNTVFIDGSDEFTRQEVSLNGVADVLNFFAYRLAAAVEVPATIFLGKSPLGMNATGDADLQANNMTVGAMQQRKLKPAYYFIDSILTRTSGCEFNVDYDFPPLLELSEQEKVDVAKGKSELSTLLSSNDIVTLEEARSILSGDEVIGNLDQAGDGFKQELEELKAEKAQKLLSQQPANEPQIATPTPPKLNLRDRVKKLFGMNNGVS